VPVLSPATEREATPLDLHTEEWEVLAEIDGERDIRQLAADLGRSAFDVAKVAYRLSSLGLIRILDDLGPAADAGFEGRLEELERMLARGDLDAAERRVRELEEAHPQRSELPMIAGRALSRQGRLRAAAESFDRAVALDPLSDEAHYHLGLAALRAGDLERAREAWTTYLRLTDGGKQSGNRRRSVERAVSAMAELRQAIESAPTE
jgi:tetratricopeptide (TPR) repeat protein